MLFEIEQNSCVGCNSSMDQTDLSMDSISSVYNSYYHYEVWAVKQAEGESHASEELLGYVARHDDSVTVGFNNKLGEEVKRRLFSSLLLSKMNGHGLICIHRMTRQVHADLQSAIENLMRYYTQMNWI